MSESPYVQVHIRKGLILWLHLNGEIQGGAPKEVPSQEVQPQITFQTLGSVQLDCICPAHTHSGGPSWAATHYTGVKD